MSSALSLHVYIAGELTGSASITSNKLLDIKQAILYKIRLFSCELRSSSADTQTHSSQEGNASDEARPQTTLLNKNVLVPSETRAGSHADKAAQTLPDPDSRHRSRLDSPKLPDNERCSECTRERGGVITGEDRKAPVVKDS